MKNELNFTKPFLYIKKYIFSPHNVIFLCCFVHHSWTYLEFPQIILNILMSGNYFHNLLYKIEKRNFSKKIKNVWLADYKV